MSISIRERGTAVAAHDRSPSASSAKTPGGPGRMATLQVHPTQRVAARHRRSSSGDSISIDAIDFSVLAPAIGHASSLGYEMLQVAGREPLLYRSLGRLLDVAKDAGMLTAVTTNGLVVCPATIDVLVGRCDVVTLSIAPNGGELSVLLSDLARRVVLLRDAGHLINLDVTLSPKHVPNLSRIVDWATEQKVTSMVVRPQGVDATAMSQVLAAPVDASIAVQVDALTPQQLLEHARWFVGPDDVDSLPLARNN
jgi:hypothetical protein